MAHDEYSLYETFNKVLQFATINFSVVYNGGKSQDRSPPNPKLDYATNFAYILGFGATRFNFQKNCNFTNHDSLYKWIVQIIMSCDVESRVYFI